MPAVARLEAVLFDFAGTLVHPPAPADWVRAVGPELPEDEVHRLAAAYLEAGLPGCRYPAAVPEHLEDLYARRDLDADDNRAAYVGLLAGAGEPRPGFARAMYDRIRTPDGWIPYADAHDVLLAVRRRGLAAGVVSNVAFDLRAVLHAHGMLELVDACTLSYEEGAAKPDPRIFRAACAAIGAAPERTLMVGDHPEADGAAAQLGMEVLILPMSPPGAVHGLGRVLEVLDAR
jgi:HAD superfamily hydrolase (TIGR01509 family)